MERELEIKCPDFDALLRSKRVLKDEYFARQQRIQVAVNMAINCVRIALAENLSKARVVIGQNTAITDAAKEVLLQHGFRFLKDQTSDQGLNWWIDLDPDSKEGSES